MLEGEIEINDKTWAEWTDFLGQVYKPGDLVIVSTLSYRSVRMYVATVDRINAVDSKGKPHVTYRRYKTGEKDDRGYDLWGSVEVPSATIRVLPIDGGRVSTLQADAHIVKLNLTKDDLARLKAEAKQRRDEDD